MTGEKIDKRSQDNNNIITYQHGVVNTRCSYNNTYTVIQYIIGIRS